ncbi:LLM class flavin-dependent oxidoreductase [Achromobacter xylosoxidans]
MSTLLAVDPAAVIEHHPSPADLPGSPFAQALRQPILLGLFLPIQAGGWSASTLERTTDWRWEYNRDLVLKAEALGFDLVFALSQWLPKGGYGGVFDGNALDSFQTTAALTSITRRILLISTIHVLYGPLHPLHLAKWGATLDHISGGRWGINVVTGHREVEHRAFGTEQIEHDRRYELAAEFVDVLQRLWREDEPLSFSGTLVMETAGCLCHAQAALCAARCWSAPPARMLASPTRRAIRMWSSSPVQARRTSPARSRSCPPTPNA